MRQINSSVYCSVAVIVIRNVNDTIALFRKINYVVEQCIYYYFPAPDRQICYYNRWQVPILYFSIVNRSNARSIACNLSHATDS